MDNKRLLVFGALVSMVILTVSFSLSPLINQQSSENDGQSDFGACSH